MSEKKEATKEEVVKELGQLLGVELTSLDRMTKDDLVKLRDLLSDIRNLVQIGVRSKKPVVAKIDEIIRDPLKGLQLLLELSDTK
jgi:hypothetical protein